MPKVLISAGEASGDRLGAGLARALLERRPDLELVGMGGARMEAAGVRLIQASSEVAVVGIWEVLAHLPAIRRAMGRLERALAEEKPDLLVPVDFPDFNLRLCARARRASVPVVYFVSPQVWAWRRGRLRQIRELVRRMLVLFPFETAFYEEAGVPVTFVGHPFGGPPPERPPAEVLRRDAGLSPGSTVVALMPGSREGEVSRHLPLLVACAERLRERRPALEFVLPAAPELDRGRLVERLGEPGEILRIVEHRFPEILTVCSAGAVAAGTASLEAALTGLPVVVYYRMNPATHWIGSRLVRLENVALPNLVAGRRVVPELIQDDCTPGALAAAVERYLDDERLARETRQTLSGLRARLGGPGVYDRAAAAVLGELAALGAHPGMIS